MSDSSGMSPRSESTANDRVYAFHRGDHPLVVFDRDGNALGSWGDGVFNRVHGIHMGPDDTIYLTDDGDYSVRIRYSDR